MMMRGISVGSRQKLSRPSNISEPGGEGHVLSKDLDRVHLPKFLASETTHRQMCSFVSRGQVSAVHSMRQK